AMGPLVTVPCAKFAILADIAYSQVEVRPVGQRSSQRHIELAGIERAITQADAAAYGAFGTPRNDVDHASHGRRAVQGRRRPLQHFDTLYAFGRQRGEAG